MPSFLNRVAWLFGVLSLTLLAAASSLAASSAESSASESSIEADRPEPDSSSVNDATGIESLLDRAVHLRRERRDIEALELFREAYRQDPSAKVLAQIALAEQALGAWMLAERDLMKALQQRAAWIEANRVHLEGSLVTIREHLGSLRVTTNVPGVQLAINGDRIGAEHGAEIRVAVGPALVVLEAPGYHPAVRSILIAAGRTSHEDFTLVPLDTHQRHPVRSATGAIVTRSSTRTPPSRVTRRTETSKTIAWSLVAGTGVLLTEAIIAQAAGHHFASEYNDDRLCVYGDLSRDQRCGKYRERANIAQTLAIVGYGAASATAITAGLAFLQSSSGAPTSQTSGTHWVLSYGGMW